MSDFGISAEWLQRLAGSLLHFVWQGALLALAAGILLRLMARRPAAWRYTTAVIVLGLMLLAPCITVVFYPETGSAALRLLRVFRAAAAEGGSAVDAVAVGQWTGWIVVVWAAGVMALSLRLIAAWVFSRRLIRSSQSLAPQVIERLLTRVHGVLLKTRPLPRLVVGERITGPMVFGWLRPVVLLPASAVSGLTEEQLLAVLAHELAHIRRYDFLVNALQHAVESVLFYHPAVWWLSSRVRREREHCCDDLALSVCRDRFSYARALIELERMRSETLALAVSGTASLTERIRRMLGVENRNRDWRSAMAALLLLGLCTAAGLWQADPIAAPAYAARLTPPPALAAIVVPPAAPAAAALENALGALEVIATAQTPQPAATAGQWITTWGSDYPAYPAVLECCNDQTIRMFMRVSTGGRSLRLRLSNTNGSAPLFLGQVHVALHDRGSEVVPGSSRQVLFGGKPSVEIPLGKTATSDPVAIDLPNLADVAISIYAPNETGSLTGIKDLRTGYVVSGNQSRSTGLTGAKLTKAQLWVSGIEVSSPADTGAIVVVGDDNTFMDSDTGSGWPSLLAARLQASGAKTQAVVVSGKVSRLLDPASPASTFDETVTNQLGVRYLVICPDFNTLAGLAFALPNGYNAPYRDLPPEERITRMLRLTIDKARGRGIPAVACTMPPAPQTTGGLFGVNWTPAEGSTYWVGNETRKLDSLRSTVNEWIRTSGAFDGVADFDFITRDPSKTIDLKPEFRPQNNRPLNVFNDRAYQAVADAIDLKLFTRP